ncbi:hypothetical protein CLOSTMETH_00909 [[Clostridium] methylpentosum DSM 5476]|uniref:Uncharacterized protein n=1 Tax=[Clostridium] methylpentosum DSM 5476 TaxID=537013 RepID=C0EAP6_9FIRM|nr:hypothetical protein CLOSTMETH_00909 [[Clostridium] methylpentosum DSM 5476]
MFVLYRWERGTDFALERKHCPKYQTFCIWDLIGSFSKGYDVGRG